MKKYLVITLALIITLGITNTNIFDLVHASDSAYTIHAYDYPINEDSEVWPNLTIQEKREALIIPSKTLEKMSDNSLYEAFIKYPLLIDVLAYVTDPSDDLSEPLERLVEYCSAYQEIKRRGLTLTELQVINENIISLNPEATQSQLLHDDYGHRLVVQTVMNGIIETEMNNLPHLEDSVERLRESKVTSLSKNR